MPITVLRDGQRQTILWQMPAATSILWRLAHLSVLLFALPFWLAGTVVLLFLQPQGTGWRLLVTLNYLIALWLAAGSASQLHVAASSLVLHAITWLLAPLYRSISTSPFPPHSSPGAPGAFCPLFTPSRASWRCWNYSSSSR